MLDMLYYPASICLLQITGKTVRHHMLVHLRMSSSVTMLVVYLRGNLVYKLFFFFLDVFGCPNLIYDRRNSLVMHYIQ